MPSKILYDTRTLEILRCQPQPRGLGLPLFNGLCKSARVPEDEKQYMGELVIEEEYLTSTAQSRLQIIKTENGIELIRKSPGELPPEEPQKDGIIDRTEEELKELKEEFIVALLEEDISKIDEIKAKYKQIISQTSSA